MPYRELNNANAVEKMTETFSYYNNFSTLSPLGRKAIIL